MPQTPHRPSMDGFWDPEFINEWIDEHSPRKLILPPVQKSPSKSSSVKGHQRSTNNRAAKKSFVDRKNDLAESFLRELDERITDGKLADLASTTGGIQIKWTNKLNTTAGRANWRRETTRTKTTETEEVTVWHQHHASIELAEKVIDDEHRLLNVIAHEFCHLANFMIGGVTGNPHGKEFKAWAAKCTSAFASRGIEVTTKHSYDIDFKYVWECGSCGTEYKRHSKSINPERHRCGPCKGMLKQTKPVPRASGKTSEYQKFVGEEMKRVREENPGSPQKEVMRMVAQRWGQRGKTKAGPIRNATLSSIDIEDVASRMDSLVLAPGN